MNELPKSTLEYLLWSLVPYSEPNLKLAFKPNLFFNDLEKISQRKHQSLRNTYYKAIKQGLIGLDEARIPRLTQTGQLRLQRYRPKKLKSAKLMVVFDIPESERNLRQRLRTVLREFKFEQIQKSVWVSQYDCLSYVEAELQHSQLDEYVVIYEAVQLHRNPNTK